ncbi:MAG: SDR family oxidoreductase [Patescibacteria group bacterium]
MILITGAKGFIGSALVSYLLQKGLDVKGISEEITDIEKLRPHFIHADFVVHLAAKVESGDFFNVNVGGTMNVVKLCIEYGCKLINTSTIAMGNDYAISKALAEDAVRLYAKDQGLQAVTIRPCIIYDENTDHTKRPFITREYPLRKLLMDIEKIILHHNFKKYKVYKIGGLGQKLYVRKLVQLWRKIKRVCLKFLS